jgi:erythromycin esterase
VNPKLRRERGKSLTACALLCAGLTACAGAKPSPAGPAPSPPSPAKAAAPLPDEAQGVLEGEVTGPDGRPAPGALQDQTRDLTLTPVYPRDTPAPAEVLTWITQAAIPLSTVKAGHGFADMMPLREVVGKARIVALGEATHGTREFFQLKHRMLEFLVEEMGFSVFAMETNLPEALAVNDHVLNGKGDPANALARLETWTWDTEEVLELIRWMRRYNQDPKHSRKVKFYGFDMQFPVVAAQALIRYLKEVDPAGAREFGPILAPLDDYFSATFYAMRPSEANRATAAGIAALIRRLDERRAAYQKRAGALSWALSRRQAEVLRQGEEDLRTPAPRSSTLRDRFMAENAASLLELEGPDAKMVVWAHNAHVMLGERGDGIPSMGSYLKAKFGSDLVVFGLAFNQGSFQAIDLSPRSRGLVPFTAPRAPEDSLDATLARAGPPLFALDLRRAPADGVVADWLRSRLRTRSIGGVYNESMATLFDRRSLTRSCDALLFVEKTTAARPNPTGRRSSRRSDQPRRAAFTDGGLEEGTPGDVPESWFASAWPSNAPYQVTLSEQKPKTGKRSGFIGRERSQDTWGAATLSQRVDAAAFRGKRVRLSAMARAEVEGPGNEAQLFLQANPAPRGDRLPNETGAPVIAVAHLPDHPIVDRAWRLYQVEMDVPAEADAITVGFVLAGNGRAFIDDVSLRAQGDTSRAEAGKAR